jgi:hypothetical protein
MPSKACGFIKLHPTDPTELLRATVRKPPSASHTTRQYTPCIHDVLHTWANPRTPQHTTHSPRSTHAHTGCTHASEASTRSTPQAKTRTTHACSRSMHAQRTRIAHAAHAQHPCVQQARVATMLHPRHRDQAKKQGSHTHATSTHAQHSHRRNWVKQKTTPCIYIMRPHAAQHAARRKAGCKARRKATPQGTPSSPPRSKSNHTRSPRAIS